MVTGEVVLKLLAPAELGTALSARVEQLLLQGAWDIAARARVRIQSPPKTGRLYQRGSRWHQASAPGESPATDYGFLVNSIFARPAGIQTAEVVAQAEYAAELEFGNSRIEPRPYMAPAIADAAPGIRARLEAILHE